MRGDFMSISSISDSYRNLSTGYRINTAADDAAGLAISEKLVSQINGYDQATENAQDGQNMLNVAEGGLSGIQENLQRIRELAVQASNGIYTQEDKSYIQMEVEQLKNSITDMAKNTEFNTMKLLDGSMNNVHLATNPQGTGMDMQLVNSTLEELGIKDFDVTKDFDIDSIDKALDKVSSARANLGAQSNRLDYTINSNINTSINLTAANSSLKDADYAKEITNLKTQQALQQYSFFAQKQRMQAQSGLLTLFN